MIFILIILLKDVGLVGIHLVAMCQSDPHRLLVVVTFDCMALFCERAALLVADTEMRRSIISCPSLCVHATAKVQT